MMNDFVICTHYTDFEQRFDGVHLVLVQGFNVTAKLEAKAVAIHDGFKSLEGIEAFAAGMGWQVPTTAQVVGIVHQLDLPAVGIFGIYTDREREGD